MKPKYMSSWRARAGLRCRKLWWTCWRSWRPSVRRFKRERIDGPGKKHSIKADEAMMEGPFEIAPLTDVTTESTSAHEVDDPIESDPKVLAEVEEAHEDFEAGRYTRLED